jgi:hypothetical protein
VDGLLQEASIGHIDGSFVGREELKKNKIAWEEFMTAVSF